MMQLLIGLVLIAIAAVLGFYGTQLARDGWTKVKAKPPEATSTVTQPEPRQRNDVNAAKDSLIGSINEVVIGLATPNQPQLMVGATIHNVGEPTSVKDFAVIVRLPDGVPIHGKLLPIPSKLVINEDYVIRADESLLERTASPIVTEGIVTGRLLFALPGANLESLKTARPPVTVLTFSDGSGRRYSVRDDESRPRVTVYPTSFLLSTETAVNTTSLVVLNNLDRPMYAVQVRIWSDATSADNIEWKTDENPTKTEAASIVTKTDVSVTPNNDALVIQFYEVLPLRPRHIFITGKVAGGRVTARAAVIASRTQPPILMRMKR